MTSCIRCVLVVFLYCISNVLPKNVDIGNEDPTNKHQINTLQPNYIATGRKNISNLVLLLDTSESMFTDNRIYKMSHAVCGWVKGIHSKISLGIIEFNNYATPLFEMAEVNPSVQKKICSSLSMKPKGGSCLGCGVHEALKMLKGVETTSLIILIMDGNNTILNEGVSNVLPILKNTSVKVVTIALGKGAEEDLDLLAWCTHGWTYMIPDNQGFTALIGALFHIMNIIQPENPESLLIFEVEVSQLYDSISNYLYVDLTEEALVELNIYYGPNKVLDYVNLTNEDTGKTELVSRNHNWEGRQITRALHKGNWSLNLKYDLQTKYAVAILKAELLKSDRKSTAIITISCWHNSDGGPVNAAVNPIIISVKLNKEHAAVLKANVSANVFIEDGNISQIELFDNGSGADEKEGDGIYSRFLPLPLSVGRYSIKFFASSSNNTIVCFKGVCDSSEHVWRRMCTTTSLKISNVPLLYAPARVNDLQLQGFNDTAINLSWTAPGDQLDYGTASQYKLLAICTSNAIYDTFDINKYQTQEIQVFPPDSARSPQHYTLNIPSIYQDNLKLYFVISTVSSSGMISPWSNLVHVPFSDIVTENTFDLNLPCNKAYRSGPSFSLVISLVIILISFCITASIVVSIHYFPKMKYRSKPKISLISYQQISDTRKLKQ